MRSESISAIINSNLYLPERFISEDYNKFLFFDVFLRENVDFLSFLDDRLSNNIAVEIFYWCDCRKLAEISPLESLSKKIDVINTDLDKEGEFYGLIVADQDRGWVLVQSAPVALGILGIKSTDAHSLEFYRSNKDNKDWFFTIDDFKNSLNRINDPIRENFDEEFIREMIKNYG